MIGRRMEIDAFRFVSLLASRRIKYGTFTCNWHWSNKQTFIFLKKKLLFISVEAKNEKLNLKNVSISFIFFFSFRSCWNELIGDACVQVVEEIGATFPLGRIRLGGGIVRLSFGNSFLGNMSLVSFDTSNQLKQKLISGCSMKHFWKMNG